MFSILLLERTSKRRTAPCAASARATWLPTNPVAPVTKAFMFYIPARGLTEPFSYCWQKGSLSRFAGSGFSGLLQRFWLKGNIFFACLALFPVFAHPSLPALAGGSIAPGESQGGYVAIRNIQFLAGVLGK